MILIYYVPCCKQYYFADWFWLTLNMPIDRWFLFCLNVFTLKKSFRLNLMSQFRISGSDISYSMKRFKYYFVEKLLHENEFQGHLNDQSWIFILPDIFSCLLILFDIFTLFKWGSLVCTYRSPTQYFFKIFFSNLLYWHLLILGLYPAPSR